MNSGNSRRSSFTERLNEILEDAIRLYSNRLTDPADGEYKQVLQICRERAVRAFQHRMSDRGLDEDRTFATFQPQPLPDSAEYSTNPLQDLVHVELFLRGHEPAVSEFLRRYRRMALKRAQAFGGPRAIRGSSRGVQSQDDNAAESSEAISEVAVQAFLHAHKSSLEKGAVSGLPGLDLRSYEGKTELFRWLCPSVTRLMGKLTVLQRVNLFEQLGMGTIIAGSKSLHLDTGYFHETKHIGRTVRISRAGQNGKTHQTRLIDVRSSRAALTEVAALTTVTDPAPVALVERRRRTQAIPERFNEAAAAAPAACAEQYELCVRKVQQLLQAAFHDAALSADELRMLKYSLVVKQGVLAKIRGLHSANVGRKITEAKAKLKRSITARLETVEAGDQECIELVFAEVNSRALSALLLQVLDEYPDPGAEAELPASLLDAWRAVLRNLPKERPEALHESPVADFITSVLRNSPDGDDSIDSVG